MAARALPHDDAEGRPGDFLLHPVFLASIGVLLLNDHLLKGVGPAWLTGKLSDVAGLAMFPAVVVAVVEVGRRRLGLTWPLGPRAFLVAAVATAVVFAATKTIPLAGDAYCSGAGWLQWALSAPARVATGRALGEPHEVGLTEDVSDLVALPMVLTPLWIRSRSRRQRVE